jgi:hypothetical protein
MRRDPNRVAAEDKLTAALGASVRITGSKGRGKILIDYVNSSELQRLFELLERTGQSLRHSSRENSHSGAVEFEYKHQIWSMEQPEFLAFLRKMQAQIADKSKGQ